MSCTRVCVFCKPSYFTYHNLFVEKVTDMKFKNIIIIVAVVVVCIVGWNVINDDNGGGSRVEKDLIETLPEDITVCYCIDNSGEKF